MKKGKFKSNLIKVIIAIVCLCTISFSMPKKNNAWNPKDYIMDTLVPEIVEELGGIVDDFINLLLAVPDGIIGLLDYYVVGINEPYRYAINDSDTEYRVYNFKITPYNIFISGTYEEDPNAPGSYITKIRFF